MRCLTFFLLKFFIIFNIYSQNITLGYNYSQVGKNLRAGYEFSLIPNFYIESGIKYITWMGVTDNQGHFFKDRFRPINFIEHFGLFVGLKYQLYKNDYINIKFFYNGAISNSHLITDELTPYITTVFDVNGNLIQKDLYVREFIVRPKTFAFENYFGGDLSFKLSKKVSGFGQLGLGWTLYHIQEEPNVLNLSPNAFENSWFMGTLGLKYHLK